MNNVIFARPDHEQLKKEFMVVDMHHHTKYSHDSNTPVQHVLDQAEELGIYVAITDHNTISGVLKAWESPRGRKWVVPGIEVTTKEKKDVLVYFYNVTDLKRFYKENLKPHMKEKSSITASSTSYPMRDLLFDLKDERCIVVLPHPVCARIKSTYHYFKKPSKQYLLEYVDGIEVINETMTHRNNLTALGWATSLGKPITAGSDGHRPDRVGEAVTAAKVSSKSAFLDAVKAGDTIIRGKELKLSKRFAGAYHLVVEKAKMRHNKRLDKEYA